MLNTDYEFLSAHFSNNERTIVESWWKNRKGTDTVFEYIEAKEGDKNWEKLLTHIDIDALHEATYQQIKAQNQAFVSDIKRLVKKNGTTVVHDIHDLNDINGMKLIVDFLFNSETEKEKLFNFKLKLLEVEGIKNSKKRSLKTKLRRSKTIMDAIKAAIEILDYK
tara:strand:+ start:746 stop:1240 length:495 start_codon:yes stop_codon:yes gene_type:complete